MMRWNACVLLSSLVACLVAKTAICAPVTEIEPNDTRATAQNIDAFFTLTSDPNVEESSTIPHATVNSPFATNSVSNFDLYSFTVTQANARAIFDIDIPTALGFFDSTLELFDSSGTLSDVQPGTTNPPLLAFNDDVGTPPDSGSADMRDAFIDTTIPVPGTYYIRVGNVNIPFTAPGNPVPVGVQYTLQVSLEGAAAVPEPTSLALLSVAMVTFGGGAAFRRRRKKNQPSE